MSARVLLLAAWLPTACDAKPQRPVKYHYGDGVAVVTADGSVDWNVAVNRDHGTGCGVFALDARPAAMERAAIDPDVHGRTYRTRLFPAASHRSAAVDCLWSGFTYRVDRGERLGDLLVAEWSSAAGFEGRAPLALGGPGMWLEWACRLGDEAVGTPRTYAVGGPGWMRRLRSNGVTLEIVEAPDADSTGARLAALFAAGRVHVGTVASDSGAVHAFLAEGDGDGEPSLWRLRSGELERLPLAAGVEAAIRAARTGEVRFVPLAGESDTLVIEAGWDEVRRCVDLAVLGLDGVVAEAEIRSGRLFACAATVGADGAPVAIVARGGAPGSEALRLRHDGIVPFTVLAGEEEDPLGSYWGERLALSPAIEGSGGERRHELFASRAGTTSNRGRVWRYEVRLDDVPSARLVEVIDEFGRVRRQ